MPVDLSASLYAQYKLARKRAEEAERRGALREAAAAYQQSADLMRQYAQSARDAKIREQRVQRADALAQLANRLIQKPGAAVDRAGQMATRSTETPGEDDYEAAILELIQKTHVEWDDIGGLEDTKAAIKAAYGLALARKPKGVEISSWRKILLFGPPGTGKTLLAAATAGQLEATFFNVKVSNLLSKYFGESSKLITALYNVARRLSPSVVFLDEFESLTPPRGSGESGAERRIVSTFLSELDGLDTKEDENLVLTIGDTNMPWLIDPAILSRFQKRIYIPLPDEDARKAILEIQIGRRGHRSQVSLKELVKHTDGFSGREIEQLCQAAITHMTKRANPNLMTVVDKGQQAIRDYEIRVEPLSEEDFEIAFAQVKPITTAEMIQRYAGWMRMLEV